MSKFTKEHTLVLKGVAILFLLIHHGWQSTDYVFYIGGKDLISNLQSFAKICVAIFVMLSGYGLYMSYAKKNLSRTKDKLMFVTQHLIKIYLTFWFVYIIGVLVIGNIIGNVGEIYSGHPLYYMLMDCTGLSYFAQSPKYVNSWWYITATVIYYVAFPVLYKIIKSLKNFNYILVVLLSAALFFEGFWGSISIYFVFFIFGMIIADRKIIDRISSWGESSLKIRSIKFIIYTIAFCFIVYIRQMYLDSYLHYYVLDWVLVLLFMLFIVELPEMKNLWRPFTFLGKYSFEMFLIHGVFINYLKSYVYYTENVVGIFFRILFITIVAALCISALKKLVHFQEIYEFCIGEKVNLKFSGALCILLLILSTPEVIANIGIGNLVLESESVSMKQEEYKVITYSETPLFWEFANVKYESADNSVAFCSNGIIFSHEKGRTQITISIPTGEKNKIDVSVE